MEHYYNNYRKQQKERERIMQRGCLVFAVLLAMMLTAWLVWQRGMLVEARAEEATENLAGQVLRFHVLADSDSLRDQQIKMQVKEEVVTWLHENRPEDADRKEMEAFIREHLTEIKKLARETVRREGSADAVTVELARDEFPEKTYRLSDQMVLFRRIRRRQITCIIHLTAGSDTARSIITGRSHCRELSIIFRIAVPFSQKTSVME